MADLDPTTRVANMLARYRHGPGVDMGGAHNPTVAEELLAAHIVHVLTPPIAEQVRRATVAPLEALCDNADATGRLIHPGQIRDLLRGAAL